MPKVSIIVPNYNHSRFLKQRLDSIFNQTYEDFEVILLDDASTDDSVKILTEYAAHEKVSHFIVNKENSGSPFKQWQKGIDLANGEFIWIAESDDYCKESFLERVVTPLMDNSNCVLSYSQSMAVDGTNRELGTLDKGLKFQDNERWKTDFLNSGDSEVYHYLQHINTIPNASGVVFKHEVAEKIANEYLEMKYFGDWYFWIQVLRHGSISFVSYPLNCFRKHLQTTRSEKHSSAVKKRLQEELKILYDIFCNLEGFDSRTTADRIQQLLIQYYARVPALKIISGFYNDEFAPLPKRLLGSIKFSLLIRRFRARIKYQLSFF